MVKNSSSIFSLNTTVEFIFLSLPSFPFIFFISYIQTEHTYRLSSPHFGFPLLKKEFIGSIIALVSLTLTSKVNTFLFQESCVVTGRGKECDVDLISHCTDPNFIRRCSEIVTYTNQITIDLNSL